MLKHVDKVKIPKIKLSSPSVFSLSLKEKEFAMNCCSSFTCNEGGEGVAIVPRKPEAGVKGQGLESQLLSSGTRSSLLSPKGKQAGLCYEPSC